MTLEELVKEEQEAKLIYDSLGMMSVTQDTKEERIKNRVVYLKAQQRYFNARDAVAEYVKKEYANV